jgi:folylpolyglutamate synthase/dihydropteroate synthase
VITNVREDHQEEMGETLEEIADSMALTIPVRGVLITAEGRDHIRERLGSAATERDSRMVYAEAGAVRDEDMRGFDHVEFKSNVAVGLAGPATWASAGNRPSPACGRRSRTSAWSG